VEAAEEMAVVVQDQGLGRVTAKVVALNRVQAMDLAPVAEELLSTTCSHLRQIQKEEDVL